MTAGRPSKKSASLAVGIAVLLLAAVLSIAPAPPAAQAASQEDRASAAVHLREYSRSLAPHDQQLVQASVPRKSWCVLRISPRRGVDAVRSRPVHARTGHVQFFWTVSARATGRWKFRVGCAESPALARKGRFDRAAAGRVTVIKTIGTDLPTPRRRAALTRRVGAAVVHSATEAPGIGAGGCPPIGTVQIAAADWLRNVGGGVDVVSNGPACTSLTGRWQCVELVNRLITAKGWSQPIPGNATNLWENAKTTDYDKHANGSGYVPVPGDIIVWGGAGAIGRYGHVQVVEANNGASIRVVQQNSGNGPIVDIPISSSGTIAPKSWTGNSQYVKGFLHAKRNVAVVPPAQAYDNHIVQWDGDRKTQKTAWLVEGGKRYWIPTSAIYYCLKGNGSPGPDVLPAATLDQLPDQTGSWASCTAAGWGVGSGPPPADSDNPPPTPIPAPANPTFTGGYVIQDAYLGGSWPRTDPNNGTWYSKGNRPANAASYWWANGLGVGFSCGAYAAGYSVRFADGHAETWNTWFRSTDTWGGRVTGLWVPSAVASGIVTNGLPPGMPAC